MCIRMFMRQRGGAMTSSPGERVVQNEVEQNTQGHNSVSVNICVCVCVYVCVCVCVCVYVNLLMQLNSGMVGLVGNDVTHCLPDLSLSIGTIKSVHSLH